MYPTIDDEQVKSICLAEVQAATDYGELNEERAEGLDRYLGEPLGDEVDGRSKVKTREVLETVEGILPSILRVLVEEENLILFDPQGEEDEDQAQQETDVVHHVFFQENKGFYNLYTFVKDALLSKTGVLKCWPDESSRHEREEYRGLDDMQLAELTGGGTEEGETFTGMDGVERELLEYELTPEGHHCVFSATLEETKINIVPCPPEEFGVGRDARSPYVDEQEFAFTRHRTTLAALHEQGYDWDLLENLPSNDETVSEERLARRHLSNEDETLEVAYHPSMRTVWVTTCYIRLDRNGDGIAELLQVDIAAGADSGSSGTLLNIEEIDSMPVFATPVNLLTHKFHGLSIADVVKDIQEIETTLLRQTLDHVYNANAGMIAAHKDKVQIDDLLTRRPHGIVRFKGDAPWQQVLGPIPASQMPQILPEVFERLDERIKRRTGYGQEVGGLDADALANVNTGVAAMHFEIMRMKLELIARIVVEIGLKPLFHHIHELVMKTNYKARAMKLRGKWVHVNPSEWRERTNSRVLVGIGNSSRERRLMGLDAVRARQDALVQGGAMGILVQPHQIYEADKDWCRAWGFEPSQYFTDPRTLPPPRPKQPSAQDMATMAQADALRMDGQSKMMRAQTEQQKLQLEARRMQMEGQYKQAELYLKGQIEQLKAQLAQMKADADVTGKVVSMEHERQKEAIEAQLRMVEMRLDQTNANRDRDLEYFKTLAQSHGWEQPEGPGVADIAKFLESQQQAQIEKQEQEAGQQAAKDVEAAMRMDAVTQQLSQVMQAVQEMRESATVPKSIEYDREGRIAKIGGQPVERDEAGRPVRIG